MKLLPTGSRAAAVAICVSGLLAYHNSLGNSFHYDDLHSLVDNPHVRSLGNTLRFFYDPGTFSAMPQARMYRPVLLVTYALNYAVGEYEPFGYHLINLVLHLVNAWLVWLLAHALLNQRQGALLAALLFAVHPVLSEPVNYISSRSSLLATFFFILAFLVLIQASVRGPSRRHYALMAAFCLAGLGSKSIAITFAAVGAAYLTICRPRFKAWTLLIVPSLASLAYVVGTREIVGKALGQPTRPLAEQWATQVKAYVFYAWTSVMPVQLSVEPQFSVSGFGDSHVAIAGLALLSLAVVTLSLRRRSSPIALAAAWSVLTLLPSSLVPLHVLVNEHRLYLPMAGGCIGVAAAVSAGMRLPQRGKMALLALALFTALTIQRNRAWTSEESVWGDAVEKGPLMARPQINLGKEYVTQGKYQEAIDASRRALAIDPSLERAHFNIGTAYLHQEETEQAIASFHRALEINPDLIEARINLGSALKEQGLYVEAVSILRKALSIADLSQIRHNLGSTFLKHGSYDSAEVHFRAALEIDPSSRETWEGLAKVLRVDGRLQSAIDVLTEALQRWPRDVEFLLMVGDMWAAVGRDEDAAQAYRRSGLDDATGYLRLGDQDRRRGRWDQARRHYEQSLRIAEAAASYSGLGKVLFGQGNAAEALVAFRKAARLEPEQSESYLNIGRVSLSLGRVAEALAALERATELEPDRHLSWGLLAQAHVDADDLPAAIKAYEKAIRRAPENSEYYNNVGLLYLREGFLEEARRMYRASLVRKPTVSAWFNLGNLHLEEGSFEEAAGAYEKALELNPAFSDAYVNLASAQLSVGSYAAARASYDRFLELHEQEDELRRKVLEQYEELEDLDGN